MLTLESGCSIWWTTYSQRNYTNWDNYLKALIAILPSGLDELHWERLSEQGEVPEGDWQNYTIKNERLLKCIYNILSEFEYV